MDPSDPDTCLACNRSGHCARCKGKGRYVIDIRGAHLLLRCHDCRGSGVCPKCDGTGRIKQLPDPPRGKLDPELCSTCLGTGFCPWCHGDGHYIPSGRQAIIKCDRCDGSGACRSCAGTGRVRTETEMTDARGNPDSGICPNCGGTGFCPHCDGEGRYHAPDLDKWVECRTCGGIGRCGECGGTGRVRDEA